MSICKMYLHTKLVSKIMHPNFMCCVNSKLYNSYDHDRIANITTFAQQVHTQPQLETRHCCQPQNRQSTKHFFLTRKWTTCTSIRICTYNYSWCHKSCIKIPCDVNGKLCKSYDADRTCPYTQLQLEARHCCKPQRIDRHDVIVRHVRTAAVTTSLDCCCGCLFASGGSVGGPERHADGLQ